MLDLKPLVFMHLGNHSLKDDEIHIWVLDLPKLKFYFDNLCLLLSRAEKSKADKFRKDADRIQYIQTRGGLRYLLGVYTGQKPEEIDIIYNKWGKPQISKRYCLNFSLSHSVDYSVIAFSKSCEVGIDIEFMNPDLNLDDLVTVFLNPLELDCWRAISPLKKMEYFYKLWVGKEAFIKALGKGWLEKEDIINSLTILPLELESSEEILKTPQGSLHYFEVSPTYKSAFFSTCPSLKPCIFNLK